MGQGSGRGSRLAAGWGIGSELDSSNSDSRVGGSGDSGGRDSTDSPKVEEENEEKDEEDDDMIKKSKSIEATLSSSLGLGLSLDFSSSLSSAFNTLLLDPLNQLSTNPTTTTTTTNSDTPPLPPKHHRSSSGSHPSIPPSPSPFSTSETSEKTEQTDQSGFSLLETSPSFGFRRVPSGRNNPLSRSEKMVGQGNSSILCTPMSLSTKSGVDNGSIGGLATDAGSGQGLGTGSGLGTGLGLGPDLYELGFPCCYFGVYDGHGGDDVAIMLQVIHLLLFPFFSFFPSCFPSFLPFLFSFHLSTATNLPILHSYIPIPFNPHNPHKPPLYKSKHIVVLLTSFLFITNMYS